jgi:ligand-binding sensor domain-containing protein
MLNKFKFLFLTLSCVYSQQFTYQPEDWYIISSPGEINSITETPFMIYFGSENGIYKYDKFDHELLADNMLTRYLSSRKILHLYYDEYTAYFWVVTDDGIFFRSENASYWRESEYNYQWNITDIGSSTNRIWIKSFDSLTPLDPFTGMISELSEDEELNEFDIHWGFSKYGEAGKNIQSNRFSFYPKDLQDIQQERDYFYQSTFTVEMKDFQGNYWFGTNTGEIFKVPSNSNRYKKVSNSLGIDAVTEIYLDDFGKWWFGNNNFKQTGNRFNMDGVFLSKWNEDRNTWRHYRSDESVSIRNTDINCLQLIDNTLFVGTVNGLLTLNTRSNKWSHITKSFNDKAIWDMVHFDGLIYCATQRGITEVSAVSKIVIPDPQGVFKRFYNREVYDLELNDNFLYVASEIGLDRLDLHKMVWENLSEFSTKKVSIDQEIVYLEGHQLKKYLLNSKDEIIFDWVEDFVHLGNFVWITTINEVTLIDLESSQEWVYTQSDGIPGEKVFTIGCDNDWVWFGTNSGVAYYNWSIYHKTEK